MAVLAKVMQQPKQLAHLSQAYFGGEAVGQRGDARQMVGERLPTAV